MSKLDLDKTFVNGDSNIHVRYTEATGRCGVVEIMGDGYVIAAYKVRDVDGEPHAVLYEIHDRLTNEKWGDPALLLQVLEYGRKLANIAVEVGKV